MSLCTHASTHTHTHDGTNGQDNKWKAVALPTPQDAISLFSDAGRDLLKAAEDRGAGGASSCARLVPFFEKQKTPTSCGVCCAVIAANVLTANVDADKGVPLLREAEVLSQCSRLVAGVEEAVLYQYGLTLRQVKRNPKTKMSAKTIVGAYLAALRPYYARSGTTPTSGKKMEKTNVCVYACVVVDACERVNLSLSPTHFILSLNP
jgi:hypothetical protein